MKTHLEDMKERLSARIGGEAGQRTAETIQKEYDALCAAYADQPKALVSHTHNNIFPAAAAFRALLAEGMEREKAAELAGSTFLDMMNDPADMLRKLLKVPGLYRLMPWIWKTAMPKLFGEDAGFEFRFYPTDGRRVKFDMLSCPYHRLCRELDCEEIAPVFCASDDICYGHMHDKLIWNRTKTLARGGDCCDFDLYIPKK